MAEPTLFGDDTSLPPPTAAASQPTVGGSPRLRPVQRSQVEMRCDSLDQTLTESVAALLHEGLIELERVAQDGMKVRASAGAASFRRQPSLQACLEEAQQQVSALRQQGDEGATAASQRQQAARERGAQ